MKTVIIEQSTKLFFVLLLVLIYVFFLSNKMVMPLEDLGRHLLNGREVLAGHMDVLYKNVYSYTHPDFPFLNHHWLTGVVFALIDRFFSLPGLYVFHITLCVAMLLITFFHMYKRSSFLIALFLGFFLVLLLSVRVAIRPESFGYLFLSILSLWAYRKNKHTQIVLLDYVFIFLLHVLWVNLHISFVLGIFFIGSLFIFKVVFLVLRNADAKNQLFMYGMLFVLSVLGSCVNPSGIRGLLYPFQMFSNYGYSIVENQSLIFLRDKIYEPAIPIAMVSIVVCFVFILLRVIRFKTRHVDFSELFRVLVFAGMAWTTLRHVPVFAIIAFPFLAETLFFIYRTIPLHEELRKSIKIFFAMSICVLYSVGSLWIFSGGYSKKFRLQTMGWTYDAMQFEAPAFFKTLGVTGNMFNNFDIGGHLDATLYPTYRVFVDNRPDAFPADFLQKEYIAMQVDESLWKKQIEKYNFHAIIFASTDMTPWGIAFLNARLHDPDWAVVYTDEWTIIFLRRLPQYAETISQHETKK